MRLLRILGFLVLLFTGCFAVSAVSMRYLEASRVEPVAEPLPALFPVLVTSTAPGETLKCRIVYHEDLEDYRGSVGPVSFVIPTGLEAKCLEQVRGFTRRAESNFDSRDPRPWSAGFEVSALANGRQAFEVRSTWDDDHINRSWYEATEDEFFAEKYLYLAGPGVAVEALAFGMGVTTVVLAVLVLIRLWRRFRSNPVDP